MPVFALLKRIIRKNLIIFFYLVKDVYLSHSRKQSNILTFSQWQMPFIKQCYFLQKNSFGLNIPVNCFKFVDTRFDFGGMKCSASYGFTIQ